MVTLVPEENVCISIVAFDEDEPVGVVIAYERDGKELYISYVLVTMNYQRKGIGKKLLEMLENEAMGKCFEKLTLHSYDWNLLAIGLYVKQGFVRDGIFGSSFACWMKRLN